MFFVNAATCSAISAPDRPVSDTKLESSSVGPLSVIASSRNPRETLPLGWRRVWFEIMYSSMNHFAKDALR